LNVSGARLGFRSEFQAYPRCRTADYDPNGSVNQPQYGLSPGVLWGYAGDDHHDCDRDSRRDDVALPAD
jgi:hypothetical protein